MASHPPEDYTIAWICALPMEAAAARAMLDKTHAQPPRVSDPHAYELGELDGHHIVIGYLPNGVYETVSAAAVVSRMRLTFPRLQFALMVGIGGGVPNKNNDIRLGDVVVSKPGGKHGGVIQYDYGRAVEGGKLEPTGLLNQPSQAALTHMSQLQAKQITGGEDAISEIVSEDSDCEKCDKEQLVKRQPRTMRTPYIHYGLVASGDQMEAAGLMNELPALAIRGICDYCDSHKQKQWQGYAALTATAYAKLLLLAMPACQTYDGLRKGKSIQHWMITKLEELLAMPDGPRRVAIAGLGGVGKTQVALELAYRIRDRDTEYSVFWVPCTSHAMVEQSFPKIAQMIGLGDMKPAEVKEQIQTYLSSERAGKWLLIFDNADDTDMWLAAHDMAPALEDSLPQSEQGRILFTTRNWELAVELTFSNIIHIPDVDKETARNILESLLLQKRLLEHGAIAQAAAYINKKRLNLSAYLTLLQDEEQAAVELLSEKFSDPGRYKDIENAVITTWLISFKQIQYRDSLAADYLSFMACINPRNIPLSLLPSQASAKKRLDALGLLNAYSFVHSQDTDINMHRLVHIATRNWLKKNGLFDHWIKIVANQLEKVFPNAHYMNRGLWRDYLPHALVLIQEDKFVKEQEKHIDITQNVADCLAIMEASKTVLGEKHPGTLTSMENLAYTWKSQGRLPDALALLELCCRLSHGVLGPDHPHTRRPFTPPTSSQTTRATTGGDTTTGYSRNNSSATPSVAHWFASDPGPMDAGILFW
ncbi:purine and uridine phosphorylase [Aspergillus desertorum]